MDISVVVPTYKPLDYLWKCLDSLASQTLSQDQFEIIVILNGCNAPYYDRIQEYIERGTLTNIFLIQTDVSGVSNARNIGIENSRGEYLTFIDDDDVVSPPFLEELLEVSSPTCVGCANSFAFADSLENISNNFVGNGFVSCRDKAFSLYNYRNFLSSPWAKLIHKSLIGKCRFPVDMKKSEDSVFCLKISSRIKNMKLTSPDAIYYQRLRPGSAMRKKQPISSIIKEHLFIEYKYLAVWMKDPFHCNFKFFLSRLVACCRNCIRYIKNQRKIL